MDKLKASRKQPHVENEVSLEVLKKVSKLERMMKSLKMEHQSETLLIKEAASRVKYQNDNMEDETVRMFVDEIR